MYDFLIKNGMVLDGTGTPAVRADIAVKDGKVALVAPEINEPAGRVLDAKGLFVSPGFVDNHSHGDMTFLAGTSAFNYLEQGITCEIAGQCGSSPAPSHPGSFNDAELIVGESFPTEEMMRVCDTFTSFSQYVDKMELGTNMAFLVGHGSVRARVMGHTDAEPTPEQLEQMKAIVDEAMSCGCVGMSTGLIYPPSIYGKTPELIELAKVVAKHGGVYTSHIRGEGDTLIEAVAEAIEIGEKAGCAVHISHHKVAGKKNRGKSVQTLRMIDEANARGIRVTGDQYPYLAGCTGLISAMPPQYMTEGPDAFVKRITQRAFRDEVTAVLKAGLPGENLLRDCGFEGCLILGALTTPEYIGKTLADVAQMWNTDPYEAMYDLLVRNEGRMNMAFFQQNDEDMMRILAHPRITSGSDWWHEPVRHSADKLGGAHPRGMATLPRHLRLVRENNLMPVEKAIYRVTGMAAEICGVPGIGYLREGYDANICVFDWENLGETNDYLHPYAPNTGIRYVLVNGRLAVEDGVATGVKAGKRLIHGEKK